MPNPYHLELLAELASHARQSDAGLQGYVGTGKPCYGLRAEVQGAIVRGFVDRHPDLTLSEYVDLLDSLFLGRSLEEVSFGGILLGLLPGLRRRIEPCSVDRWLDHVEGWAETDAICQSRFTAQELLARWDEWHALLIRLAGDANVHKRRASLVLLTRPVRESADGRLAGLAFANVERLKGERHILVTKAVSWLLRDLIKHHYQTVTAYLAAHEATLPRVAVRETRRKLLTGRK